jgi:hypothetical protein
MSCVNRTTARDNGKLPFSPAMWLCPEINFHQIGVLIDRGAAALKRVFSGFLLVA